MEYDASIILCTINEIENLPIVVKRIEEKVAFSYQFVFVDDGSNDGTREFILDYCKSHKNAKYIFNKDKQSTLIAQFTGMKNADGRYFIILDADLQHPPEKVQEIFDALVNGFDIVVASRYINGAAKAKRNAVRGLISRVAGFLAIVFIKNARRTTDPLSGFFGLRRDLKILINEKWRGYKMLLFILSSNPEATVKDIPYIFEERVNGHSKVTKGFQFIRIYLTELLLAKKIELANVIKK
ncbi:MAG: glycosyltransferase [Thermoplasmatales archaeon]